MNISMGTAADMAWANMVFVKCLRLYLDIQSSFPYAVYGNTVKNFARLNFRDLRAP